MRRVLMGLFIFSLLVACAVPEKTALQEASPDPLPDLPLRTVGQKWDPQVKILVEKSEKISTYHYAYDTFRAGTFTVSQQGMKAHKVYLEHQKIGKNRLYNHVYLDAQQKMAWGICTDSEVQCQGLFKKAFSLPWIEQNPGTWTDPLSLMRRLPVSAVPVGTEQIDQRSATILEYTNAEGKREQVWVDSYFGFPLQQVIYGSGTTMEEKHTFTRPEINRVAEADVQLPEDYDVIS